MVLPPKIHAFGMCGRGGGGVHGGGGGALALDGQPPPPASSRLWSTGAAGPINAMPCSA